MTLTRIIKHMGTFSASHQLPNHQGKCRNLHGHEYAVEVEALCNLNETDGSASEGMGIDFTHLKEVYKERIEQRVDHALLLGTTPLPWVVWVLQAYVERNGETLRKSHVTELPVDAVLVSIGISKVAVLPIPVTTAEYLAKWMAEEMMEGVADLYSWATCPVVRILVRVWETPTSAAEAVSDYKVK